LAVRKEEKQRNGRVRVWEVPDIYIREEDWSVKSRSEAGSEA